MRTCMFKSYLMEKAPCIEGRPQPTEVPYPLRPAYYLFPVAHVDNVIALLDVTRIYPQISQLPIPMAYRHRMEEEE